MRIGSGADQEKKRKIQIRKYTNTKCFDGNPTKIIQIVEPMLTKIFREKKLKRNLNKKAQVGPKVS